MSPIECGTPFTQKILRSWGLFGSIALEDDSKQIVPSFHFCAERKQAERSGLNTLALACALIVSGTIHHLADPPLPRPLPTNHALN